MGIIRGGDTAATDYFQAQTAATLTERYRPIIEQQLQTLGFYDQYKSLLGAYKLLPMANKPDLDLEQYAVNQGVSALFQQIGLEEQRIRANPLQEGTAFLAKVLAAR